MADYRKLLYSVEQGVARVTLNRPGKRNALDAELVGEIRQALDTSAADDSLRLVLLAGAGKDFCSGADLAALQQLSQSSVGENIADARRLGDMVIAMRRHPRPIVATVRGRALAGGCGLATAADIVLAAESAQFGYPEVKIGFVPAMVMAFELLVSGEVIPAAAALEMGMINRVFADAAFGSEVAAYVSNLAAQSASALSLTKSLLYQMDALSFEAALSAGIEVNALARTTADYRRGIEQFLKKS